MAGLGLVVESLQGSGEWIELGSKIFEGGFLCRQ